jgi:hypothetical protein
MQIRLYYESIYLNVEIFQTIFAEVSHAELQLDLWKDLWDTRKSKTWKVQVFQNELYNFESLYKFIQGTCAVFWTDIM